ncbi:polyprenyl synthetase family protein [bacterium]|nr:polyprenyl synthetase family protein [bacterium]
MKDFQSFYTPIKEELILVEEILRSQLKDVPQELSTPASSLIFANGKRLRPALLLNICKMLGRVEKRALYLSAGIELVHTASLIHDDVIDEADLRRGNPSINAKWGNKIAVLVGDLLVAKAARLFLKWGNKRIFSIIAEAVENMSRGEALELLLRGKEKIREKDYLKVIELKTASLFSATTRIGAILGEANREEERRLFLFGKYIGLAFQITDDILNITSDEKSMGKPIISDIKEGTLTLPFIPLLKKGILKDLLAMNKLEREELRRKLEESGGLEKAKRKAEMFVNKAKSYLASFPPSPAKEAVLQLSDFIILRER